MCSQMTIEPWKGRYDRFAVKETYRIWPKDGRQANHVGTELIAVVFGNVGQLSEVFMPGVDFQEAFSGELRLRDQ